MAQNGIPSIEEHHPSNRIHVECWMGVCTRCQARHWFHSGWASYYLKTQQIAGYAGYGRLQAAIDKSGNYVNGEWCRNGCKAAAGEHPLTTIEPAPLDVQHTYHAAYRLGGEVAIIPMLDVRVIHDGRDR